MRQPSRTRDTIAPAAAEQAHGQAPRAVPDTPLAALPGTALEARSGVFKPGEIDWLEALEDDGRIPFEDPAALDELRRNAMETFGLPWAAGVVQAIAFAQGMLDGLRVDRGFCHALTGAPASGSRGSGLLFTPEVSGAERVAGRLVRSVEASLHRATGAIPDEPVCWASAGYASGWYSGLLGGFWLVHELGCRACGDRVCSFEGRPARHWLDAQEAWARQLLPYIDHEEIRAAACQRMAMEADAGEMAPPGAFDAASPAAHVWGPVAVMPYAGIDETLETVDAIEADASAERLRAVLLDVTGTRIEGPEIAGLLRLVDALEARNLELVIVGLRPGSDAQLRRGGPEMPLQADDMEQGIALAFQLAQLRRS